MPKFYFHLAAPDEFYTDKIGANVPDLTLAHRRAVMLANRVLMVSALADHAPNWRKWRVNITDERNQPVMTVLFQPTLAFESADFVYRLNGAHALAQRLHAIAAAPPKFQVVKDPALVSA